MWKKEDYDEKRRVKYWDIPAKKWRWAYPIDIRTMLAMDPPTASLTGPSEKGANRKGSSE